MGMRGGKVEICGVNTSELTVLSSSEKEELLKKAANGDKKAREKLISGNLKLVLSVIKRFSGRGENPDDLFQVGCIGLIKAIDNFDLSHGVKFSTYAVPTIVECRENVISEVISPFSGEITTFFIHLLRFLYRADYYQPNNCEVSDEHQLRRLY